MPFVVLVMTPLRFVVRVVIDMGGQTCMRSVRCSRHPLEEEVHPATLSCATAG